MQKKISIFVDESGDFGKYDKKCPYYIISMVFHDQKFNISSEVEHLDEKLKYKNLEGHTLHVGPLIRREYPYTNMDNSERMKILTTYFMLFNKLNIKYKTFIVEKTEKQSKNDLIRSLSKQVIEFINTHHDYFSDNKFVVYYDNGQEQVSNILATVFSLYNCEFKTIRPDKYKLFQVADLVTTFELINYKRNTIGNSKSELHFFGSMNKFNKDFYKKIKTKKFN